jgi:hypothetical protein
MKPVPFAEFLARREQSAASAAHEAAPKEALSWPPRPRKADGAARPRVSPLLPQDEAEKPDLRVSTSQRIEQGRLLAFEDGREAARRELEVERERMRDTLAADVAQERKKWAEEEAALLAAAHRAAFEDFETRCAQAVANILRPFMIPLAINRVTGALVENLETLFASRTRALFEISGPADLLDALRDKFADRGAAIAFKPDETIDVRVRLDDTIIETQLEAWMTALDALPQEAESQAGESQDG